VAVFLFVRPPASKSEADTVRTLATPTQSSLATATATPPGGGPTRAATAAATVPPSVTPVASGTAAVKTHTVASGETLSRIAADNSTTVEAIQGLNPGIPDPLPVGTVLKLP
jgi:LysM repeat protein